MKKSLFAASIFALVSVFAISQSNPADSEEKDAGAPRHNLVDSFREEGSTDRSAQAGFAEEEFRRSVYSYYRGNYKEAIAGFERALSYLPGENRILEWLGKAYYMSGVEGEAIRQWEMARQQDWGGLLLPNKIEIVGDRRVTDTEYGFTQRYTEAGSFPNVNGKTLIYSHPISSLPNSDGSIWVVAYGSNELLRYDVNGMVLDRVRGLEGFDRPVDIIRLSGGHLLVSESSGNRLSELDASGKLVKHIGKKGRGLGELIGPQYLAEDSQGNIYVTDYGNCRVVVFDQDGNGLLSFGRKTDEFDGLKSPTGIAIWEDRIFVADSVKGGVYEFDRAGNYRGILVEEGTLKKAEGMKCWGNYLIIADRNRVLTVDVFTGSVFENAATGNGKTQITSAVPDKNGNIIVTDFKANEIYVMSKMSELIGGFFVQIQRVYSDSFPKVTLELKVENRKRQPIVGLGEGNFLITEDKRPVANMQLTGSANNNTVADLVLLIDRSYQMRDYEEQVNTAVREIAASMDGKGSVMIVSASSEPTTEFTGTPSDLSNFSVRSLKAPYASDCTIDKAISLSVNNLISAEKKRAVIYITAGDVSDMAFNRYSLSDLTAFMNNNSVSFNTILMSNAAPAAEIEYITDNTTGESYYVYRPEGLSSVMADIISIPSGVYMLSYTSSLSTDFGRRYLPVEVEAYLLSRSGRDETGYFAPLQ
ncbi:MAG: VWA domain-containing protein [Treponema sp.]|nr:VWA domain-containing protein [Treponema sp.]